MKTFADLAHRWTPILSKFQKVVGAWGQTPVDTSISDWINNGPTEPHPLARDKKLHRSYRRVISEVAAYFLRCSKEDKEKVHEFLAKFPSVESCFPYGMAELKYFGDSDLYALGLAFLAMTSRLERDPRDTQVVQGMWREAARMAGVDIIAVETSIDEQTMKSES